MKLIAISNPVFFEREAAIINRLFEAGLSLFHLRKEAADPAAFLKLIRKIDPAYYPRIALHQFHETAAERGISRLHFNERNRSASSSLLPVLQKHFTLSTSIHNLNEATDLKYFKYTFYSPVFDSISKKGYLSVCDAGFSIPPDMPVEIIALGGVDSGNIGLVKEMKFDGAALMGCLWKNPENAAGIFKKIMEQCQ